MTTFKMPSSCGSENVLPLTKKTPVESAALQRGPDKLFPLLKERGHMRLGPPLNAV